MSGQFFSYHQNNSGGSFDAPAVNVHVEADSLETANNLAANHFTLCGDSGRYADYDNCGCCPCCGHRWSVPYDDKPTPKGAVEDYRWSGDTDLKYLGGVRHALIKADGSLIVGNTQKKYDQIAEYVGLKITGPKK